jgi:predicted N-formylglutamate amidohydrolase
MSGLPGPDEPRAATLHDEPAPAFPVLLVCDHASRRIPVALASLGLGEAELAGHIAWDIGAAELALALAARLRVPALLNNWSRLVIDCNRALDDPTLIPAVSGGVVVPGNQALDPAARALRIAGIHAPYHAAVAARLARFACAAPAIIAIHSFTPRLGAEIRPWHLGVLWDKDPRISAPLLAALRGMAGLVVGDNQPYSGRHPADYTMDHHGEAGGLAHVSIELRQDLLMAPEGVSLWSRLLADALVPILADEALYAHRLT